METGTTVKQIFREFVKDKFGSDAEKLKIYIYGLELQICGGVLKFEDELDITLMSHDLRFTGYEYTGHKCMLPEMCAPFAENAVVLVSCIYPYQYEDICAKLEKLGLSRNKMVHARPLAEKLLNVSAEFFSQNAMDLKVKTLFDSVGKDISTYAIWISALTPGCFTIIRTCSTVQEQTECWLKRILTLWTSSRKTVPEIMQ